MYSSDNVEKRYTAEKRTDDNVYNTAYALHVE
jgi:hypothetical protein